MVNEEIITGLRNAIEHGDSLQEAMQILVNSGYNPTEVQEASGYVSGGSLYLQQPKPEEHLVMPSEKSLISKKPNQQQKISQIQQSQVQQQVQPSRIQQNRVMQPNQVMHQNQSQIMQAQSQPTEQFPVQQMQQYTQISPSSTPLTKQLDKIKPRRQSYFKEIMLLFVLLILIGALVATIIFKDTILAWFA